ncbi:DUF4265 domain-containing protein [Streptomyces vietnamensis]|uniref:DUF4265 domain-containing protein n=1 Tax=Streptomyces vietnamensis TaxID=362257 RepID=A0A0B5I7F3_9ACTN|nr:DUF4265 domain-containing protein [Streptomyces vietnamensis]AJF65568.1 hypothetical protein SVTN_15255 [Streptomyces vietnamensis]
MSKKYVVHEDPVVRTAGQYIAMADLAPFGFPDLWEQIWLGRREDGLFVMQCVPFRIYGLNLFDVVRLDEDDMLVEVVEKGGHRTLRALLEAGLAPQVFDEVAGGIAAQARSAGFALEWSGDRHAAIDVPGDGDSASLVAFMDAHEGAGTLFWEWSDAEPFQAPQRGTAC